jgi:hypothetical protein
LNHRLGGASRGKNQQECKSFGAHDAEFSQVYPIFGSDVEEALLNRAEAEYQKRIARLRMQMRAGSCWWRFKGEIEAPQGFQGRSLTGGHGFWVPA